MTDRTACGGLQVATELYRFINEEAIPGTGIDASKFWAGVDALIHELAPVNRELVAKRDVIQEKIDAFHKARRGQAHNAAEYKAFLEEIGYLLPEPQNVSVSTDNVDPEVATTAGPQLVVPVMNARYALNAANARWEAFTMRFMEQTLSLTAEMRVQDWNTTQFVVRKLLHLPRHSLTRISA